MLRKVIKPILIFPLVLGINFITVLSSEAKDYIDDVLEEKVNNTLITYFIS